MSAALANWGKGLIALALFGLLVELLLPSRATEGYVRLIVGLVLLTAVVWPILGVVRGVLRDGLGALPGASAGSLSAVLASASGGGGDDQAAIAGVFASEMATAAAAAARTVRGVRGAQARAHVGRSADTYGQLLGVDVTVEPTKTAQRDAARVAAAARAAVAASLGVSPSVVVVRVRYPGGPAP